MKDMGVDHRRIDIAQKKFPVHFLSLNTVGSTRESGDILVDAEPECVECAVKVPDHVPLVDYALQVLVRYYGDVDILGVERTLNLAQCVSPGFGTGHATRREQQTKPSTSRFGQRETGTFCISAHNMTPHRLRKTRMSPFIPHKPPAHTSASPNR